ncbi:uncharacterized protein LOC132605354 [Lycium barbarum]|uniref:uncharacterized protein LOC132605354 n=1 Tax=Lycium barbarum TaxID=112863 RepID=UPI00293E4E07|nr:uncharacterized protein LOC132605354 [Lycium barbarum]
MTCSICHGKNHNKRGCPLKDSGRTSYCNGPDIVAASQPSFAESSAAPARARGRLRKTTPISEAPAKDWGRPRKNPLTSDAPARASARPKSTSEAPPTTSARPRSTFEAPPPTSERPRSTSQAPTRGMGTRRTTIIAK